MQKLLDCTLCTKTHCFGESLQERGCGAERGTAVAAVFSISSWAGSALLSRGELDRHSTATFQGDKLKKKG